MPDIANAIPGVTNLDRKREKEARLAELEVSDLPDWMFWDKTEMDTYITDNVTNLDQAKTVLKALGHFVRIVVRLLKKYEERP